MSSSTEGLIEREQLNEQTHSKILVKTNGSVDFCTAPIGTLLGTDKWKYWRLAGGDLCVAFIVDSENLEYNVFWERLRHKIGHKELVPRMRGDFVVCKYKRSVAITAVSDLQLQIFNFLVSHYVNQ